MGLELDLIQTVAIGSFNPAIVTPDWLHDVGICQPGAVDATSYLDWADANGFVAGGFEWEVDYTRLVIATQKEMNCGAVVARVLRELPHTPVEAIGHNFHFCCSRANWDGVEPHLGNRTLATLNAEEVRWDGRFQKPNGWVEVTLRLPAADDDFVVVMFNHHHLVDGASVKDRSASAISAANRFEEDREATKVMLKDLFNIG